MPEINLLQNQLKDTTQVAKKRTMLSAVLTFIVLVLLVGTIFVLYFLTKQLDEKTLAISNENIALRQKIEVENAKLNEAKAYQAQLSNVKLLLKNHVSITPFLQELNKYTYLRAQFISVTANQDLGKIHVEGTVENYDNLGKLLLGLSTSSNFSNVKLVAVQATGPNVYTFSIDLIAASNLFTNIE